MKTESCHSYKGVLLMRIRWLIFEILILMAIPTFCPAQWQRIQFPENTSSSTRHICDGGIFIYALQADPDNRMLMINKFDGRIYKWKTLAERINGASRMLFDGHSIWIGHNDGSNSQLIKVDTSLTTATSTTMPCMTNFLEYDGQCLWTPTRYGTLARIDPDDLSTSVTMKVMTIYPIALFFDGDYLWWMVSPSLSSPDVIIYKIDPYKVSILAQKSMERGTLGYGYDGQCIYFGGKKINRRTLEMNDCNNSLCYSLYDGKYFISKSTSMVYDFRGRYIGLSQIPTYHEFLFDGTRIWSCAEQGVFYMNSPHPQQLETVSASLTKKSTDEYSLRLSIRSLRPMTSGQASLCMDESQGMELTSGPLDQPSPNTKHPSFEWTLKAPSGNAIGEFNIRFFSDQYARNFNLPISSEMLKSGIASWSLY